jgi:para-nitrobenzyl esterase
MTVHRWLGIPYARAERFQAPELVAFEPERDATSFGPAAPQALDGPLGEIVPGMRVETTDEHACLTLNVWSPEPARDLPVLVWFHGGSFVIGASSQPVYDGSRLAEEQSVVVVSVNYRLGAFGFIDARACGGVANCGVRDAIAALQWIHDNVARFGGDPARIVPFGESAGGGVILHTIASPPARDLVSGAIVQSGATFATLDAARAAVVVETLTKEAALDDPSALVDLPADALVAAQSQTLGALLTTIGMMPFHPMVDGDVVPAAPTDRLSFDRPLLAGTTSDEMALFVDRSAPGPPRDKLVRRAARYLKTDESAATAIVARYERALETDDTAEVWRAIFGDNEMQVPLLAVFVARPESAPSWTYCFSWEGPDVGACHGIDIPFTFGNFVDGWDAFVALDDDGQALSRTMRDAWAEFARTGDPGWPAYPNAMILGRDPYLAPSHPLFVRATPL